MRARKQQTEGKTLQIANIQKDEAFETLQTRIMPMIQQAVRYENSLPGIQNPLKELKEWKEFALKELPLSLLAFFKCFWEQRCSGSRVKMPLILGIQERPRLPAQGLGPFPIFNEAESRDESSTGSGKLPGEGRSCILGKTP